MRRRSAFFVSTSVTSSNVTSAPRDRSSSSPIGVLFTRKVRISPPDVSIRKQAPRSLSPRRIVFTHGRLSARARALSLRQARLDALFPIIESIGTSTSCEKASLAITILSSLSMMSSPSVRALNAPWTRSGRTAEKSYSTLLRLKMRDKIPSTSSTETVTSRTVPRNEFT